MIVAYNADLEVSNTCVRNSQLSWVELSGIGHVASRLWLARALYTMSLRTPPLLGRAYISRTTEAPAFIIADHLCYVKRRQPTLHDLTSGVHAVSLWDAACVLYGRSEKHVVLCCRTAAETAASIVDFAELSSSSLFNCRRCSCCCRCCRCWILSSCSYSRQRVPFFVRFFIFWELIT